MSGNSKKKQLPLGMVALLAVCLLALFLITRHREIHVYDGFESGGLSSHWSDLYSTKQEMRGRWLDFRFETRFSRDQDGQIDAWLNGEPIVHYKGPTVYQQQRGYPAHGLVYFKMGLYRDEMQQPMTIYVDEYRKDELRR